MGGNPETFTDPSGHSSVAPDNKPTQEFDDAPTGTGTPSINLGPLFGAIGATLAAFGVWLHSQFTSTSSTSTAASVVAARSQSNAMDAWNAYVAPTSDANNVGVWIAHGYGPTASVTSSGGGGGGGGTGSSGGGGIVTVKRLPPPTENGEAIGFGSPILSGNIVPECDPQLALEALCIGWTRFWRTRYVIGETMRRVRRYARENGFAYYQPRPAARAKQDIMTRNAQWLLQLMARNTPIYDIGFDPKRSPHSANYQMELAILVDQGYPYYIRDPQP